MPSVVSLTCGADVSRQNFEFPSPRTSFASCYHRWCNRRIFASYLESLATQTLVLFVIRTSKNPLRSRPSGPLTATCLAVVVAGIYLPFSPLARVLGFTALPGKYFVFLGVVTASYLLVVEAAKRRLLRAATGNDVPKGGHVLTLATAGLRRGEITN